MGTGYSSVDACPRLAVFLACWDLPARDRPSLRSFVHSHVTFNDHCDVDVYQ